MSPDREEALLKEIRENFEYASNAWREVREEASKDMRYITGDPWDPAERRARSEKGKERPCLSLDELNQYTNQLVNSVRMNRRAIKVIPRGLGSNEKTAELRQAKIREIEYRSNALAAYATAFEDAATRSYGFIRINKRYASDRSFDQELHIGRIPNPDTVYLDPDFKEADASDIGWCFVVDRMRKSEFQRQWPDAKITSFTPEMQSLAPLWVKDADLQIAEYWRIEKRKRRLVMLKNLDGSPFAEYLDALGKRARIEGEKVVSEDQKPLDLFLRGGEAVTRETESREVVQYITNGVEILDELPWDGKYIPIIPFLGKEVWMDDGAGAKRKLMSLIRLARDPFMLYCYYRTCQAELVGMTPKTVWIGYEGQFENHEDEWQTANKSPLPYLQVKPVIDATGTQVLPLPQRNAYEPPIQSLELGAEAARRAIQAAMGISPLPTAAQRNNEKSGIALEKIQTEQNIGTFHFVDNHDRALMHAGRVMDDLLDSTYDTPRDTSIVNTDDSVEVIRINEPSKDKHGQPVNHKLTDTGDHGITVSTGPSFESQREEADEFLDGLMQHQPEIFARVAWLAIKLKNLGPIGDEMVKILTPPDLAGQDGQPPIPPQVQQAIQMGQQQLQQLHAYAADLEKRLVKAESAVTAKQIDAQTRKEIAVINSRTALLVAAMKGAADHDAAVLQGQLDALAREEESIDAAQQATLEAALQPPAQPAPAAQ